MTLHEPDAGADCHLCKKGFKHRNWVDETLKGVEIIRMCLVLCEKCYYTYRGTRIPDDDKEIAIDTSEDTTIETTENERVMIVNLIRDKIGRLRSIIIYEWLKGRISEDEKPDDMTNQQLELYKLIRLFKTVSHDSMKEDLK
jgi:hypothetical protein